MSPRTGRPTTNKKTKRLEIRLTNDELNILEECATKLKVSKTEVINRGVWLLKSSLDEKK